PPLHMRDPCALGEVLPDRRMRLRILACRQSFEDPGARIVVGRGGEARQLCRYQFLSRTDPGVAHHELPLITVEALDRSVALVARVRRLRHDDVAERGTGRVTRADTTHRE